MRVTTSSVQVPGYLLPTALLEQDADRQIAPAARNNKPEGAATAQRTSVLAVDDRPGNLLAYQVMLDELDVDLVTAGSGEEALNLISGHDFAVILLDVNMPGMDGFETAKAIREREESAHTPIIFLTAFAEDSHVAEAYAQGAVDFIEAPAVPAILRAKVKVFADLARMADELSRRQHQEVIKESAERMRLILDSSLDAVISIDQHGKVTGWNPQAETIFGWSRESVTGQDLATLIIPEPYRVAQRRGLEHFLATGEGPLLNRRLELYALRRDGDVFPVELTISALNVGGRHEFSAFIRDISQRKTAEEQIRRYAAELERSNRELTQFAYSASHDLRSPLRAVAQVAEWIIEDHGDELPGDVRRDLGLMQQRVGRMQRLLDDMLEYARAGRYDGDMSHVDSRQLVREIVELLALPPEFKIAVGPMPTVLTHRTPLEQVLRNLIGNAVKHHNRPDGCVEVSATDRGDHIEFVVKDDGPGIPAEYHEQIFQMFTTLKPRDTVEGSGMGLALVKKIVDSRGGAVRVESDEGRGATFRFTWPRSA